MAKKQYLSYQVNVPDRALAESLAAQYPDGVTRAPYNPVGPAGMAVEAANLMAEAGLTVPNPLPVLAYGTPVTSPSLTSLWFDSSNSFPRDVATFSIDTGWWIFGSHTKFFWVAKFVYAPAAGANPDTTPAPDDGDDTTAPDIPDAILRAPMPTRMHLDGMELSGGGEAPVFSGSGDDSKSAAGATLFEGVGFAARQRSTTLADRSYQHPFQLNHKVWDRFYFRVRRYPTAAPFEIFRITSQASSGSGARVYVTQGGQYAVYTATGSGETLVGTFGAVPLNTRLRVDVFGYVGDDGAGQVQCVMYFCVNGQLIANTTHLSTGLLVNGVYGETYLGHPYGTLTGADVDFDDWRISSLPNDKDFKLAEYNPASTYIAGDRVKWTGLGQAGPRVRGLPGDRGRRAEHPAAHGHPDEYGRLGPAGRFARLLERHADRPGLPEERRGDRELGAAGLARGRAALDQQRYQQRGRLDDGARRPAARHRCDRSPAGDSRGPRLGLYPGRRPRDAWDRARQGGLQDRRGGARADGDPQ